MSDYNDDIEDDDQIDADSADETTPNTNRKDDWRRKLEQDAKDGRRAKQEADKATAEAATAKKELAFLRAGIDLDSPQGKLFAKAYDGEPSLDAVKAAAQEYGLLDAPSVPAEELAGHDRFAQASAGSSVSQTDDQVYFAELDKATTVEETLAVLAKAGITPEHDRPGRWSTGNGRTPAVNPL